MVSKIHACLYHTVVQMNLWEFWDVLHGANRDIWLNIAHTEMRPLSLPYSMVMNLAHGPDETDLRFKQTTDFINDIRIRALQKYLHVFRSTTLK